MVHLTKIYTKTGDKGTTAVANNKRVDKFDPQMAAIGSVDEANSAIGLLAEYNNPILDKVQNDLFDLGADLAGFNTVKIGHKHVTYLEKIIDGYVTTQEPLNSFVLPTGGLHFARSLVRRAERDVWYAITIQELLDIEINPIIPVYLNRLSDLLFVMARDYNKGNEKLWKPMGK